MITRIEITYLIPDTREILKEKSFRALKLIGLLKKVKFIEVYTINKSFTLAQLKNIASSLVNSVIHKFTINKPVVYKGFNWAIEAGFLPGVTDNIGNTAKEIIEDLLKTKFKENEGVYASNLYLISGILPREDINNIANSLINPLIQRLDIKTYREFKRNSGMDKIIPQVKLLTKPVIDDVNLNVSDKELSIIGKKGILNKNGTRRGPLALDLTYMKTIANYFKGKKRNPTDIELESIAQTWSEHCKHTIFANPIDEIKEGLFEKYIKGATKKINKKFCASVFTDNSGAVEFNKDYLITHKVETHNSPSALDPFGGAITGIVGVNRDAIGFGKGAKPIVNIYGFCFADPTFKKYPVLFKDPKLSQKMLPPDRIMAGVIAGVNNGGNCSGIPTPLGFIYFDRRFLGKPLVFVGTIGLIPKKANKIKLHLKKAINEDYIVMVGGRVGLDGIHGATFSSEALDSGSPQGAVQIGDPITQKKMSDAIVKEARDKNLYNSITDNGAGGLSCSVAEMAKETGGCLVNLEKVPLKYSGLNPWQIWISESQERMTLAVPQNKWPKFKTLMNKRGIEATIIGKYTNSGKCIVWYHDKKIMDIDMDFLHNGLPVKYLKTASMPILNKESKILIKKNYSHTLLNFLTRPNICGFEFISSQYDHEVQGSSVIKPLQGKGRINGEVSLIKPIFKENKGLVISYGLYPNYSDIDTYHMAACSIDTAVRNIVAAGGDLNKTALLDNFCWCLSNDQFRLGQLKKAVKACYDVATFYQTPFISGKDSMFNDFKGFDEKGKPINISIPPTLLISSISIIANIYNSVSLDLKFPGDLIYILGETNNELGASEYYAMNKAVGNAVPKVNTQKNLKLYQAYHKATKNNLIASAISVNRGGLAVALVKTSISGLLGIDISLKDLPGCTDRDDFALFSESQGRIIVSINPKNKQRFEKIMKGNIISLIGKVTDNGSILVKGRNNKTIINIKVNEALTAYKSTFKNY